MLPFALLALESEHPFASWYIPLVNQEYRCQPQENKEPTAVGDGGEHDAGADGRVTAKSLHQ